MSRVLASILSDLDPMTLGDVEGNASCDIVLGSNQIFLVNAFPFPLKPMDIAASNFAGV